MLQRCCFPMGPLVAQGLAALIANLTMFSVGMIFGWSSPSLPKLLEGSSNASYDESGLQITLDEGSWVVSLISFGAIFGPILLNLVVDRIGRKWSLSIVTLPILISWLVIGLATSVEMLYVGRFIGGLSLGAVYALMPMYLGEIAEDRIRGALGTLMSTVINVGMLMSFCIGPWISRQMLSVVSALPPLVFLMLSPWMPETPYFLLMKANLGGFLAGTMLGWGTAVVPMLQDQNIACPLNSDQIGWVMSVLGVGGLIGAVITWLVLDVIGRKTTLILSMIPMITSYVIMAVHADYAALLIGRIIGGIGVGMFMSTGPLYIGEVAENRVRGAMGVIGVISTNFGYLFVYLISPDEIFSELNTVCASVGAGLTILLLLIPESPYYYLARGDTENARSALVWLRRTSNVKAELHAMKTYVDEKKMQTHNAFDLITNSGNRRALTILLIVQTMQPFSGSLAIPAYAFNIFNSSGYEMSPYQSVTMMGLVMLIASFVGVFTIDVLGRRPVLFFATAIMSLCLVILAAFYTLKTYNYDISNVTWIPFVAVMGYVAGHSAGLHSLPAVLLSEYFPTNVKAKAAMIFTILLSLGGSAAIKLFQLSVDALGFGSTFVFCCAFLLVSTVILFFIMPETKGCSLTKIEGMHNRQAPSAVAEVSKVDGNFGI